MSSGMKKMVAGVIIMIIGIGLIVLVETSRRSVL